MTKPVIVLEVDVRALAADGADAAFLVVDVVAHVLVQLLELAAVGGVDRADAERALRERVGAAAVEIEEPDRLEREQFAVGDEVRERHAFEEAQPREPLADVERHDVLAAVVACRPARRDVLIRRHRLAVRNWDGFEVRLGRSLFCAFVERVEQVVECVRARASCQRLATPSIGRRLA